MEELKARLQELLAQDSRTKDEKREINTLCVQIHELKVQGKTTVSVAATTETETESTEGE